MQAKEKLRINILIKTKTIPIKPLNSFWHFNIIQSFSLCGFSNGLLQFDIKKILQYF